MNPDATVLVISCDRYSDAWELFFRLFWKHWPECPYKVCLGANYLGYPDPRVRSITVGDDKSWSGNLLRMLEQITTPYVLLCLDDYFVLENINTAAIRRCFESLEELGGNLVLVSKVPKMQRPVSEHPQLSEVPRGTPYRASLNVGCWRASTLRALVCEGESAWDFEIKGSERSNQFFGFYASRHDLYRLNPHAHIRRGIWLRPCLRIAKQMGVQLDLQRRPVMSRIEHGLYMARQVKARIREVLAERIAHQ